MFFIFCAPSQYLHLDRKGVTIKGMTTGYFSITTTCVKEKMESCRQSRKRHRIKIQVHIRTTDRGTNVM
jgi:hypothetical protein